MSSAKQCYIIAEVGSVHDGSLGNALSLIETAAECGVDAVKFQTHIAEAETLPNAPMPSFFHGEPRYQYFQRTAFSLNQWCQIRRQCEDCSVDFISSPFSEEAVDLLERVGVVLYKVPSGEVTNLPLLQKIAQTHKPLLLSSGMSSWEELDDAVNTIRKIHDNITVMQCTSEYPCPHERVGFNIMEDMQNRYGVPVGFSDHTLTTYASLAAVVLGAKVIERHFTFSRKMYGSDAKHSLEPEELSDMVKGIRAIEEMLISKVDKDDTSEFVEMKEVFEKSIVSLVHIPEGSKITNEMIGIKKPGTGIPAKDINKIIGSRSVRTIEANALLSYEDLMLS